MSYVSYAQYYVYHAYGVNGELLYVGKGSGSRLNQCVGGTHSNIAVNRYYFNNGEEGSITTKVVARFESNDEALAFESEQIKTLNPVCNAVGFKPKHQPYKNLSIKERLESNLIPPYTKTMKAYIDAVNRNDKELVAFIDKHTPIFSEHVLKLGTDKIILLRYCKKHIEDECEVSVNKSKAYKHIKFRKGNFHSYADIKVKLQTYFDDFNVNAKAKATDIKMVYNVKRTMRGGVEGFLIGDKL